MGRKIGSSIAIMGRKRLKAAVLVIVAVLLALLCVFLKASGFNCHSAEQVRGWILSFGWMGPMVYIVLFTLVPLTLFPDAVLAVASGLAFGLYKGALYTWIGALCGATLSFYIARLAGKDLFQRFIARMGHHHKELPAVKGFLSVLVLRFIPLVPFDLISYGAGLSSVRYREFISATAVGIIPGVMVYVNLGDKVPRGPGPEMWGALLLLVVLTGITACGVRHMKGMQRSSGEQNAPESAHCEMKQEGY